MEDTEFLKRMGEQIRLARNKRKLTVRQLGKLCSLHYTSVSQIERGNYSSMVLTLKRIADVLNVEVKDFL